MIRKIRTSSRMMGYTGEEATIVKAEQNAGVQWEVLSHPPIRFQIAIKLYMSKSNAYQNRRLDHFCFANAASPCFQWARFMPSGVYTHVTPSFWTSTQFLCSLSKKIMSLIQCKPSTGTVGQPNKIVSCCCWQTECVIEAWFVSALIHLSCNAGLPIQHQVHRYWAILLYVHEIGSKELPQKKPHFVFHHEITRRLK